MRSWREEEKEEVKVRDLPGRQQKKVERGRRSKPWETYSANFQKHSSLLSLTLVPMVWPVNRRRGEEKLSLVVEKSQPCSTTGGYTRQIKAAAWRDVLIACPFFSTDCTTTRTEQIFTANFNSSWRVLLLTLHIFQLSKNCSRLSDLRAPVLTSIYNIWYAVYFCLRESWEFAYGGKSNTES